jgi:glycosyltransferase involved in cell wall biosynthesis
MESGTGESARSLVRILQKTTVPFSLHNIENPLIASNNNSYRDFFLQRNPYDINIIDINANEIPAVIRTMPPNWIDGKYNIGYWVWELENFPKKWSPSFACFDEIWSPSAFSARSIQQRTALPVIIMPHAINIEHINASYSRKNFGLNDNNVIFLFIFSLQSAFERKNPLAVISAFRKAFFGMSNHNACLVLKISGAAQHRWAYDEIRRMSKGLPIIILNTPLDISTVYRLMELTDCYVSLHRSEGFGLTIAESMFLGKPCIATAYSGNMEFMNETNSFPVNYTLKRIESSIGPYTKGEYWAEPDTEHAADLMRFIYEHSEKGAEIGAVGARYIRDHMSPQALSSRFEQRLKEIRLTFASN